MQRVFKTCSMQRLFKMQRVSTFVMNLPSAYAYRLGASPFVTPILVGETEEREAESERNEETNEKTREKSRHKREDKREMKTQTRTREMKRQTRRHQREDSDTQTERPILRGRDRDRERQGA